MQVFYKNNSLYYVSILLRTFNGLIFPMGPIKSISGSKNTLNFFKMHVCIIFANFITSLEVAFFLFINIKNF